MGGLIAFFILFGAQDPFVSGLYLSIPILIGGVVCSSRMLLGAHNRFEMVTGFLVGFLAQCLAWLFRS
jgi:membrane-associated phospholipid phosphatase